MKLGRHLEPPLDQARLARQFAAAYARVPSVGRARLTRGLKLVAIGAILAAAAGGLVVMRERPGDPSVQLATLEGTELTALPGENRLTLPDGTLAVLESGTRLRVAIARRDMTRLVLDEGGVDLDVAHVEARTFVVAAAMHEVMVRGTRFSVRLAVLDGRRILEVVVASGEVHVRGPGGESVLRGGGRWSTTVGPPSASEAASEAPRGSTPQVAGEPLGPGAESAGAAAASAASDAVVQPGAATVLGPKELLARAEAARATHHPEAAARDLDLLRKRYRRDPRAGLAAFELGRIRMDALKNLAGAAEAFADAIALAPEAPFREDAEARRVEALEAVDPPRCVEARDAYLGRYPQGLHRGAVAARCNR